MKRIKIFPRDLSDDCSLDELREALRNQLQLAEKEQNLLDGGGSVYRYTIADVEALYLESYPDDDFTLRRKVSTGMREKK